MRKSILRSSVAIATAAFGLFAAERAASACLLSLQCPAATPVCSNFVCVADTGGGGDITIGLPIDGGTIIDLSQDAGLTVSLPGVDGGTIIDVSPDAGIVVTLPGTDAGVTIPPLTNGCAQDTQCGGLLSGVICGTLGVCVPGCDLTNGCAVGLACSSTTGAGICVVPAVVTPPDLTDAGSGDPTPGDPTSPLGCTVDTDCGSSVSGLVCDILTGSCLTGCHLDLSLGNGCPIGLVCDPAFDMFGRCIDPTNPTGTSSSSSSGSSGTSSSSSSSSGGTSSSSSSSSGSSSSSSSSSSGGSSSSSSSSSGGSSSSSSSGGATGDDAGARNPITGSDAGTPMAVDGTTGQEGAGAGGCNVTGNDSGSSRLTFVGLVLGVGLLLRNRKKRTA